MVCEQAGLGIHSSHMNTCIYAQRHIVSTFANWLISFQLSTSSQKEMSIYMAKMESLISPDSSLKDNLTVVTAFFDIGTFCKGTCFASRSLDDYLEWTKTFGYLLNPLVVYTDSSRFQKHMERVRAKLFHRTEIFLIDRNSSWAFRRKELIRDIYSTKGYPVYYPNTVVPEYPCAQHAKYDVVARAATENYFRTDYFTWLDIGLFRHEVNNPKYFTLEIPPGFNSSRIAVDLVYDMPMDMEMSRIFKEKMDWVCGCIFMGERNLVLAYTEQYKRAVDYFLSQRLMNTDQQVLYAMYSTQGRKLIKADIDLQLYKRENNCHTNKWFYLGYLMRKWALV